METTWKICKEMFSMRGYILSQEDYENLTMVGTDQNNEHVHLFIVNAPKLNIKLAKYYYYLINTNNIKHCIIVYNGTITTTVRTTLSSFYNIRVELFMIRELQFNIMTHELVPLHTKTNKTAGEDYSKYPVLKNTDPVAKFMGFQSSDLIQIDRRDGTISYRIVK
jgi:DNA-directed RNA polymerase subunit H (RpoH/RPB5)